MAFIFFAAHVTVARHLYVATHATPAAPYDTWANAFTNLQQALDYLVEGDTLYLAGHDFEGGPLDGIASVWITAAACWRLPIRSSGDT